MCHFFSGAGQEDAMFVHAQSFEDLTADGEHNTDDKAAEVGDSNLGTAQEEGLEGGEEEAQEGGLVVEQVEEGKEKVRNSNKAKEEDVTSETWRSHRKHMFVLSEAGKPIYTRYGTEEALSSIMGVMMLLMSFVEDKKNIIRSIHTGKGYLERKQKENSWSWYTPIHYLLKVCGQINIFIQQECMKLISVSKIFIMLQKISVSNKCCSLEFFEAVQLSTTLIIRNASWAVN